MNARRSALVLVLAVAAGATACSKDKEVLAFVSDFDTFSNEIVKQVKQAPNPSAGVDAAQKYLDDNRARIKTGLSSIKSVKNFQISEATKKTVEQSLTKDATAVASLQMDYVMQMATDTAFRKKIEKLVGDYRDVVAQ
jgi:hypothetical protein